MFITTYDLLNPLKKMLTKTTATIAVVIAIIATAAIVPTITGQSPSSQSITINCNGITLALNSDPNSQLSWLHTQGQYIENSEGDMVILRGANVEGYEIGALGTHSEADYSQMASWGFNVVRLPVAWSYIEPSPGVYNMTYFQYIDQDIDWARQNGLHVILDMHQWEWSAYFTYFNGTGNGFPAWACSGYPNSQSGQLQAEKDFWDGLGPNGTMPSATNLSLEARFINVWKLIASRYGNDSTVAGYDLFNEPAIGTNSTDGAYLDSILPTFYETVISSIRQVDPNHIIFWEPRDGDPKSAVYFVNSTNVVFAPHFYNYEDPYSGNIDQLYNRVTEAVSFAAQWDQPIFYGECGVALNSVNSTEWVRDLLSVFDQYQLGYAWWSYSKSDEPNMDLCYANGTGKAGFLQYLDRPYVTQYFDGNASINATFHANNGTYTVVENASQFTNIVFDVYLPALIYGADTFKVLCNNGNQWSSCWNPSDRILVVNFAQGSKTTITIEPT